MSNDIEIEQEIQDKGLTAPRITPDDIQSQITKIDYHVFPDSMVTVCCLTLINGFNTIGYSARASPENFNKYIGEKIALRNAAQEIWVLEGYLLKQKLYDGVITSPA